MAIALSYKWGTHYRTDGGRGEAPPRATASKRKHLSINTHPLGNLDMLGLLTNINTLIINPLWISHDFDAEALSPSPVDGHSIIEVLSLHR